MKTCTKCQQSKPFNDFHPRPSSKSGYQSWCKECKNASRREKPHPPLVPGETKEDRLRRQKRESYARAKAKNPRLSLERTLKKKYGLAIEDYDQMLIEQDNKCYVCSQPPTDKETRLAVDHCHTTGRVRKLLCNSCNSALGFVDDDVSRLSSLIAYLEEHA